MKKIWLIKGQVVIQWHLSPQPLPPCPLPPPPLPLLLLLSSLAVLCYMSTLLVHTGKGLNWCTWRMHSSYSYPPVPNELPRWKQYFSV